MHPHNIPGVIPLADDALSRRLALVPIHEVNFPGPRQGPLLTGVPATRAPFRILFRLKVAKLFWLFFFFGLRLFFLFCHFPVSLIDP